MRVSWIGVNPRPSRADPAFEVGAALVERLAGSRFQLTRVNHINIKESIVRGAVMYTPGDVRVKERPDPRILKPTTRSSG
jgi:hypothetical protein